jgi:hypothetical protein
VAPLSAINILDIEFTLNQQQVTKYQRIIWRT